MALVETSWTWGLDDRDDTAQPDGMNPDPSDIEAEVRTLLGALAANADPAAFKRCRAQSVPRPVLGTVSPDPGRTQSWAMSRRGTTKQAAWSRRH